MEALALKRLQRKLAAEQSAKDIAKAEAAMSSRPQTAAEGGGDNLTSRKDSPAGSPMKSVKFASSVKGSAGLSVKAEPLPQVEEREEATNAICGLPIAPKSCHAIGKDGSAAVWWTERSLTPEEIARIETAPIIKWEILRYRMDKGKVITGEWKCKGSTFMTAEANQKLSCTVDGLSNGHQYKFAVRAINSRGAGAISPLSNAVAIDAPLPAGWMRFHDAKTDRMFFANLKTNETSWRRPELDPFFLEEEILVMFERREIEHLKELFVEDIAHAKVINEERLIDICREVGEVMPPNKAHLLLAEFGTTKDLTPKITTWTEFMNLMYSLKYVKKTPVIPLPRASIFNMIMKALRRNVATHDTERMGQWETFHSESIGKAFYVHRETHEKRWTMPDEIRFYISPPLFNKLMTVFNIGHLEAFKRYFSIMDVDASGDLSPEEIRTMFSRIDIKLPDKLFDILIHIIDLNNNRTVEYDEFCFMMFTIAKRFHIWKTISRFNQKLIADSTGVHIKLRFHFIEICNRISNLFVTGDMNISKTNAMTNISLIIGPRQTLTSLKSTKSSTRKLELARNGSKKLFESQKSGIPFQENTNNNEDEGRYGRADGDMGRYTSRDDGLMESTKWEKSHPDMIHIEESSIDGYVSMKDNDLEVGYNLDPVEDADYDAFDFSNMEDGGNELNEEEKALREKYRARKEQREKEELEYKKKKSRFNFIPFGRRTHNHEHTHTELQDISEEDIEHEYEDELLDFDNALDIEIGSFLHKSINAQSVVMKVTYKILHEFDVVGEYVSDHMHAARVLVGSLLFHQAKKVVPLLRQEGVHGNHCFCGCRRIL